MTITINNHEFNLLAIKLGLINEDDKKGSKEIITLIKNNLNNTTTNVTVSEPIFIDQPDDTVRFVQRCFKSILQKYRYRQLLLSIGSQHQNIIQHAYKIFKCSCDVMKDTWFRSIRCPTISIFFELHFGILHFRM